jgi:hypothetical protein
MVGYTNEDVYIRISTPEDRAKCRQMCQAQIGVLHVLIQTVICHIMHLGPKKAWQLPFYGFHTTNQVVKSSLHFVSMHSWFELEAHTLDPCACKCKCSIVQAEMFTQFGILSNL